MSETTTNPTQEEAAKIATDYAKVRLAHEAMMLEDAREVLARDRKVTANHQSDMLGVPEGEDSESSRRRGPRQIGAGSHSRRCRILR